MLEEHVFELVKEDDKKAAMTCQLVPESLQDADRAIEASYWRVWGNCLSEVGDLPVLSKSVV